MAKPRYYYWDEAAEKAQGPAQLPVLAVLHKQGNINGQTYVCVEGKEEWFPLAQLPEYGMLNEIAPEGAVVLMPEQAAAQEKQQAREGTIRVAEKVLMLVLGIGAVSVLAAGLGFLLPGALWPVVIVLSAVSLVGWVMILMVALEEGMSWVTIVAVVPFGDVYFSVLHLDRLYWPLVIRYTAGFMAGAFVIGAMVNEIVHGTPSAL